MANIKEIKQAKAAYEKLCAMLDDNKWKYKRDDDNFTIDTGAQGDDLPMDLKIVVDPEKMLVSVISPMAFPIPEKHRVDIAVAVSLANYGIVDGCFDYNFLNGKIYFRLTSSIIENQIGKDALEYMVFVSCSTIDKFNDKFVRITLSDMSIDDIVKLIKEA